MPNNTVLNQVDCLHDFRVTGDLQAGMIGGILLWTSFTLPRGFLDCDGAEVSRTTYDRLYARIGTIFGEGDGSTTFNLPDLRGRVPMGSGQGAGLTNRAIGSLLGIE